ncbi:MAG: MBL fold metallo-hydrolase [Verrucomicrobiales bacterium]|nr:MBL fold metallo-hydrolase [Verrucomicrobiales bacterium]
MKAIQDYPMAPDQAALWWLGQAGYVLRAAGVTVTIDPYLTDSVGAAAPEFSRLYPSPLAPEDLRTDLYLVTHDHGDHLDPETLRRYPAKESTWFVAPRLAARRLADLGVPAQRIHRLDAGESLTLANVEVRGVFALPTGADVLDTTGYWVRFPNGRSVYHTSDTAFHPLVLAAAPREPEVLLVPINGKWGNPSPADAATLAEAVRPRFAFPNHYDLMALNAENPEVFRWFCQQRGLGAACIIPRVMEPFPWSSPATP